MEMRMIVVEMNVEISVEMVMLNTSNSINKTIVDNTNATNPKVSSVMFIRMACRHHSLQ